jgi:hypothetical protein
MAWEIQNVHVHYLSGLTYFISSEIKLEAAASVEALESFDNLCSGELNPLSGGCLNELFDQACLSSGVSPPIREDIKGKRKAKLERNPSFTEVTFSPRLFLEVSIAHICHTIICCY